MGIAIKHKRLATGGLILLLSAGAFLVQNHYRSQKLTAVFAPCKEAMRLNPSSGGLPCYQAALRAYPGNQALLIETAKNLACLGRFEEARPLCQKAAGEFGLETDDAKRLLQPGALQQWKASMDQLTQANKEYTALVQQHGREAIAFQAAHDTRVEPYKMQMRELVKAHVHQELELMVTKGGWPSSVLQEPYYLTRKH